jgi:hypothetical protein
MVLVENPKGKGALETHRRSWKDNIEIDLQKIEWERGLE